MAVISVIIIESDYILAHSVLLFIFGRRRRFDVEALGVETGLKKRLAIGRLPQFRRLLRGSSTRHAPLHSQRAIRLQRVLIQDFILPNFNAMLFMQVLVFINDFVTLQDVVFLGCVIATH